MSRDLQINYAENDPIYSRAQEWAKVFGTDPLGVAKETATILVEALLDHGYLVTNPHHTRHRYESQSMWRQRVGAANAGSLLDAVAPKDSAAAKGRLYSELLGINSVEYASQTKQLIMALKGYQAFLEDSIAHQPHDLIAKDSRIELKAIKDRMPLLAGDLAYLVNKGHEVPILTQHNVCHINSRGGKGADGDGGGSRGL